MKQGFKYRILSFLISGADNSSHHNLKSLDPQVETLQTKRGKDLYLEKSRPQHFFFYKDHLQSVCWWPPKTNRENHYSFLTEASKPQTQLYFLAGLHGSINRFHDSFHFLAQNGVSENCFDLVCQVKNMISKIKKHVDWILRMNFRILPPDPYGWGRESAEKVEFICVVGFGLG